MSRNDLTGKRLRPFLFTLWILCFGAYISSAQDTELHSGESVAIKYNTNIKRIFRLGVKKEQVVSITVRQNGTDVKVELTDPQGVIVADSDFPFSEQENEEIFIVAKQDGYYSLKIIPKFPDEKGSIVIKNSDFKSATDADLRRAEAVQLFSKAQALRMTGKKADRFKAIEIYEKSLAVWREISDKMGELRTLAILSYLQRRVGNEEKSLALAEEILQFSDSKENETYKSDAFYQIAQIQYEAGEIEKAIVSYQKALSVLSAPSPKEVNILATMAYAYQSVDDFELAEAALSKAVANIRQFPDMYNEAQMFQVFGLVEYNSSEFELAVEHFKMAAALREKFGNRQGQAISLSFLGMSYQGLKMYDEALAMFKKSLPVSEEMGDTENQLDTLIFIAQVLKEKGNFVQAFEYYKKGIALHNDDKDAGNLKSLYLSQGVAFRQISNFAEARKSLEKALDLYRKTGDIGGEAMTLYQLALLASLENNLDEAKTKIERALQIHEYEQAKYRNLRRLSGFLEQRRRYFDLYIDVLMRLDKVRPNENFALKALQTSESARMRTLIWQMREALKNTPQNIDYQIITQLQKIQRQIGEQFGLLAKAQSDAAQSKNIPAIEKTIADLNRQDELLKAQLRASNPNIADLAAPPTLSLAEMQAELDDDTALIEYSLGEQRSYLWIVGRNSFQSFTLPKRAEIDAQAQSVYETLNQPTANRPLDAKVKTAKIIKKDAADESAKLSAMLAIEKLAQIRVKRLVFATDGALNLVPFSSLNYFDAGEKRQVFLAEKFDAVNLPSLTTLHILRQNGIKPFAPKSTAVIADPVFSPTDNRLAKSRRRKKDIVENSADLSAAMRDFNLTELSRLLFTRLEAENIAANSPNVTSLNLDFKANRERIINGDFDHFDILHFATHGFLNNRHPELSGLVLSLIDENGGGQNGFLRTQDLYLLNLKPQLVVLSACQTGLGKQVENEGLIGLTRGFLANGTPRVISTLWKVDDAATAELMARFYRVLFKENQSPSTALRTAQNELRSIPRFSHPRFWAGFVLTGEWR